MEKRIVWATLFTMILLIQGAVAVQEEVDVCQTNDECLIGDYLYSDSYIPYTEAGCTINITAPNGTQIVIDEAMSNSSLVSGYHNYTLIPDQDGYFLCEMFCNFSGDFGRKNCDFTALDTTLPTINFISPTPPDGKKTTIQTVTINVSHTEFNPDTLTLNWDDEDEYYSYSGSYTNITKEGLVSDTYNYYVKVNDTSGNEAQTSTRSLVVILLPATELNLACENTSTHYLGLLDNKMYWTCRLNTTDEYSCWSYVYLLDKSQMIQVNPEEVVVPEVGIVDYFQSQHGFSSVYFTDKNLKVGNAFTYSVECIDEAMNWGSFERNVSVEYQSAYNVMPAMVWISDNALYIVGAVIIIVVVLSIGLLIYKKKGIV